MTTAQSMAHPTSFDRRLLAPMMLGSILNPINTSIIAVALVPIAVAFGAPASETAWLVSSLYLATSIGQPLVGRLIDTFGPRRLFLIGAVLTLLSGVIGVLAPNIWVLVVARVVLGFGTCAGYPAAMYLIRSEGKRTGMTSPAGVLTALSITTQTIAVIGPTLGGLLIGWLGWQATIGVNIPLGALTLILGWFFVPAHTALDDERPSEPERTDFAGILLFAATLVALLLFLMEPHVDLLWLLAIALVAGVAFTWRELRARSPFLDLRVLAGNAPLLATYGRTFASYVVSYAFVYGVTQWLEEGRGLSPAAAGLILLPAFGVGILVAALTGRRPEVRGKMLVGSVAQLIACGLLLFVGSDAPIWLLVLVTVILGIPQGLLSLANQNALYFQADASRIGEASGLLRTFMYLGAMAASAATGLLYGPVATTTGLHALAIVMIVAAVVALLMAAFDRSLASITRKERG